MSDDDTEMEAFQAKASAFAAKAIEFCNGDAAEANVLVAAAAAMLTMTPFNQAATIAASEARIASRTAEHEAFVDRATVPLCASRWGTCGADAPLSRSAKFVQRANNRRDLPMTPVEGKTTMPTIKDAERVFHPPGRST